MGNRIDLYINKDFKEYFDQIVSIANIEGVSIASKIHKAVENYVLNGQEKPKLLSDRKAWNGIIENLNKDELLEYNKLIFNLNNLILRKLCLK